MADAGAADWPAVLQTHRRWLRTVLYSRLRESDAVDEVFQEVALAAAKSAAEGKTPDRVAPWLYRVAIRQVLLYRRRCGRTRRLADRYARQHPPREADATAADPLQWLLDRERSGRLRRAMTRLPRRDMEILLLKYAQDWSYRQIAEHLGISQNAVESRLHRARKRLRCELAESGVAP